LMTWILRFQQQLKMKHTIHSFWARKYPWEAAVLITTYSWVAFTEPWSDWGPLNTSGAFETCLENVANLEESLECHQSWDSKR
jgi:hypothetical protein